MKELINTIEELKNSPIKTTIDSKMREFGSFKDKNSNEIFKELCFCFMTANFQAQKSIYIQEAVGDGFLNWPEEKLSQVLRNFGHRFPNTRAKFIVESRVHKNSIKEILNEIKDEQKMRNWLVENFRGIGMKEASHFLRNIGYKNIAIIDFHIIDLLVKNNLIKKPKSLTEKKYLEIENMLNQISKLTNLNLGELDLYLWYKETGKVLK